MPPAFFKADQREKMFSVITLQKVDLEKVIQQIWSRNGQNWKLENIDFQENIIQSSLNLLLAVLLDSRTHEVLGTFFVCYLRLPFLIECDLKCYGYGFKPSLVGYLDKGIVRWRGRPGISIYSGVYTGGVILPTTFKVVAWGKKRKGAAIYLSH